MPSALRANAAASGVSSPRPSAVATKVPTKLAALTVVLGLMVGAGSAALLFQERVTLIVAAWSN